MVVLKVDALRILVNQQISHQATPPNLALSYSKDLTCFSYCFQFPFDFTGYSKIHFHLIVCIFVSDQPNSVLLFSSDFREDISREDAFMSWKNTKVLINFCELVKLGNFGIINFCNHQVSYQILYCFKCASTLQQQFVIFHLYFLSKFRS